MDSAILSALAEPNRLMMVELLQRGPLSVGDIAEQLQMRQPQVSKHLRVLLEAGVVEFETDANRRIYGLRMEPFHKMDAWLEPYRPLWGANLDGLNHYLHQLQNKPKP
ncbi:ArsR/SmtB family transcription factor [Paenibacillus sp. GCM10023252]|uniref:ArsR/SmtB family transcription factor n=1 Tax=Paenibacillus sp. GCM10023252 TaxID=3252649 RepID=UPI00360BE021